MVITLIFISIILFIVAFALTENNAKNLLAGYNTMSPEEREKVNIKGLIAYFKKFFIFLAISIWGVGFGAAHFFNERTAGLIISLYIVLAFIYLVFVHQKFYKKK